MWDVPDAMKSAATSPTGCVAIMILGDQQNMLHMKKKKEKNRCRCPWEWTNFDSNASLGLVSLCNCISTFVGYLILKPPLQKNSECKGVHRFPQGISLKVSAIELQELELTTILQSCTLATSWRLPLNTMIWIYNLYFEFWVSRNWYPRCFKFIFSRCIYICIYYFQKDSNQTLFSKLMISWPLKKSNADIYIYIWGKESSTEN